MSPKQMWLFEELEDSDQVGQAIQWVAEKARDLAATGRRFALEDVLKDVATPEGFDRRRFGPLVAGMVRRGEIQFSGYRRSINPKCHMGIKQEWSAGPNLRHEKTASGSLATTDAVASNSTQSQKEKIHDQA